MHWFSHGVALLAALGIIGVGVMYLSSPRAMTSSFGLPLPDNGANTTWWLRLKGMRDIVSGLVVVATMAWASQQMLGIVLLIEALIPAADMSIVLAARGAVRTALGIHGLTAALMIAAGTLMITGAA